jgi:hypothetical protein
MIVREKKVVSTQALESRMAKNQDFCGWTFRACLVLLEEERKHYLSCAVKILGSMTIPPKIPSYRISYFEGVGKCLDKWRKRVKSWLLVVFAATTRDPYAYSRRSDTGRSPFKTHRAEAR